MPRVRASGSLLRLGDIGKACARLARAYQMRVKGLRRNTNIDEQEKDLVEHIYPPECISDLMSSCDYVVVATPYTPATHQLVSAAAIAAMQPHAVLINVGRGKCVNEAALVQALTYGRIRGAALDVFENEPLLSRSPLWSLNNVLVTPHCADRTREFQIDTLNFFVTNMRRFLAGEQLKNVCDKREGY